jgi:RpiB/LacA/LacB family sugar-phosphate isomerase
MKKYNMIVPLAGKGQRMLDGGYSFPKALIRSGDKHIIDWSMASVDYSECNLIFIVRKEHVCNFSIDEVLKEKYGSDIQIVESSIDTAGTALSCYLAKDLINNDIPLIVFCPDIYCEPKYVPEDKHFDGGGFILTFKANSSNYSYVCTDENGFVTETAEKSVISQNASVGVYCFKSGKEFIRIVDKAQTYHTTTRGEYFICPLYNLLIEEGHKITTDFIDKMYIMGTPEELVFFEAEIWPYLLQRTFILCADHSGYAAKELAKNLFDHMGQSYIDCGAYSGKDCDYMDYIEQAHQMRMKKHGSFIIGFCRSGQGINIAANSYQDLRAALVTSPETASLAIQHNAANFFSLPGGVMEKDEMLLGEILEKLRTETFDGGRHQNRVMKICKYRE